MKLLYKSYGNATLYVAEGGASCQVDLLQGRFEIFSLKTDPKQRRQGHATTLLKQIVRMARRLNKTVVLTCAPFGPQRLSFQETLKFYEKCGFHAIERGEDWAEMVA